MASLWRRLTSRATPDPRPPERKSWSFFSGDGGANLIPRDVALGSTSLGAATAYTAAAYAYAAMRWRAARLAECPLMVVEEDRKTGDFAWLANHPLSPVLDVPSPDYTASELLFRTSLSLDAHGSALWLQARNERGKIARLQLYRGDQFEVEAVGDRLRGRFRLQTQAERREYAPDEVVYFSEPNPNSWQHGLSKLDVFLEWLQLSEQTRRSIEGLLKNAVKPSLIVQPDAEWNPTEEQFREFTSGLDAYARSEQLGRPLTLLGGGTATVHNPTIENLVPVALLNRVESVAASVFGVPAIVLQFEVGLQNSPWSQMQEARRMAFQDTAEAAWAYIADTLTRQLLRRIDTTPSHLIRFDTSRVRALQTDQSERAAVAQQLADIASPNERRAVVGLEPLSDPAADEMPWDKAGTPESPAQEPAAAAAEAKSTSNGDAAFRRFLIAHAEVEWTEHVSLLLQQDRDAIARLWDEAPDAKGISGNKAKAFLRAVLAYLEGTAALAWSAAATPVVKAQAERAGISIASTLAIRWDLAIPGVAEYAAAESAFLVRSITDTTRDAIAEIVGRALALGDSAQALAKALRDATAFSRSRAILIARTESTRVANGATQRVVESHAESSGLRYRKRWNTALDNRVREEHQALEGEEVELDAAFSNGRSVPDEPNCRCVLTYERIADDG